jgi:hypothetical protein
MASVTFYSWISVANQSFLYKTTTGEYYKDMPCIVQHAFWIHLYTTLILYIANTDCLLIKCVAFELPCEGLWCCQTLFLQPWMLKLDF